MHVDGLEHALTAMAAGPVVFAANHVGWWDGLLSMALDDVLDAHARTLVDPGTVARLPFLRAMGFVGLRGAALGRVEARGVAGRHRVGLLLRGGRVPVCAPVSAALPRCGSLLT